MKILNSKGQGLVSVLAAAAIGAVILGFTSDMIVMQFKEQKYLSIRFEMNDLTNNLLSTLSKSSNCTCQFANSAVTNPNFANYANLNFDSTVVDGSQKISMGRIYSGCLGGANAPLLLASDGLPLPNSNGFLVDKVELVNLRPTGGPATDWQGQLTVSFISDGTGGLKRSVKPVSINQRIVINNPGTANSTIASCSAGSVGTGTSNFLAKWSPLLGTLEDSVVFEDNATGFLGVGTTTPTHLLHVAGGANQGIRIQSTGGNGGELTAQDNTHFNVTNGRTGLPTISMPHYGLAFPSTPTAAELWLSGYAGLSLFTLGAERVHIDGAGYVGIGTTSPQRPLHVSSATIPVTAIIEGGSNSIVSTGGAGLVVSNINATANNWVGTYFHGNAGPTASAAVAAKLVNKVNDYADISLITRSAAGWSDKLYITSPGNVGIGTTSPGTKLHVANNGSVTATVENLSGAGWSQFAAVANGSPAIANVLAADIGSAAGVVGTNSNHPLTFRVNLTERMRIDTSGNVGIGDPTPNAKLDVNGGIRAGSEGTVTLCNATTEGTQRYNYTTHYMEFCGGSPLDWIPVNGFGQFQTVCVHGWAGANTFGCCQLNVSTGAATCKNQPTTYPINQPWTSAGSPFSAAGTGGPFQMTCVGGSGSFNFMTCCRWDVNSGSTLCRERSAFPSTSWSNVPAGNPF